MPYPNLTPERFYAKVDKDAISGCWLWKGASRHGVGRVHKDGVEYTAARFSCECAGVIHPRNVRLRQTCGNSLCVNSAHIVVATLGFRFWEKVQKGDGCWLWVASFDHQGYGKIGLHGGKFAIASRVAYELVYGSIPEGLCVCHKCDTPACVRPDHLFLGARKDNSKDAVSKGRSSRGERRWGAKLTDAAVLAIRAIPYTHGMFRGTAVRYGVSGAAVRLAYFGRTWKHLPGAHPLKVEV